MVVGTAVMMMVMAVVMTVTTVKVTVVVMVATVTHVSGSRSVTVRRGDPAPHGSTTPGRESQ